MNGHPLVAGFAQGKALVDDSFDRKDRREQQAIQRQRDSELHGARMDTYGRQAELGDMQLEQAKWQQKADARRRHLSVADMARRDGTIQNPRDTWPEHVREAIDALAMPVINQGGPAGSTKQINRIFEDGGNMMFELNVTRPDGSVYQSPATYPNRDETDTNVLQVPYKDVANMFAGQLKQLDEYQKNWIDRERVRWGDNTPIVAQQAAAADTRKRALDRENFQFEHGVEQKGRLELEGVRQKGAVAASRAKAGGAQGDIKSLQTAQTMFNKDFMRAMGYAGDEFLPTDQEEAAKVSRDVSFKSKYAMQIFQNLPKQDGDAYVNAFENALQIDEELVASAEQNPDAFKKLVRLTQPYLATEKVERLVERRFGKVAAPGASPSAPQSSPPRPAIPPKEPVDPNSLQAKIEKYAPESPKQNPRQRLGARQAIVRHERETSAAAENVISSMKNGSLKPLDIDDLKTALAADIPDGVKAVIVEEIERRMQSMQQAIPTRWR